MKNAAKGLKIAEKDNCNSSEAKAACVGNRNTGNTVQKTENKNSTATQRKHNKIPKTWNTSSP